jgi:hypothetical protein
MQLIRIFSSPRDSILHRFLYKMSETTILKRDWETTNESKLFNDKTVMFLFQLMFDPKNRVNSWVFEYLEYDIPDMDLFKRRFKPSTLEKNPCLTGQVTTSLDQDWMVIPFNIMKIGKHWLCLLRTTVFILQAHKRLDCFMWIL